MLGYVIGYTDEEGINYYTKHNKAVFKEDFTPELDRAFVYTKQGIKVLVSQPNHAISTIKNLKYDVTIFEVEKTIKILDSKVY